VLWFTGLSGAGKSTIAKLLEQQLHLRGRHLVTERMFIAGNRAQPVIGAAAD
jgi:adenylate kinase family enzyme